MESYLFINLAIESTTNVTHLKSTLIEYAIKINLIYLSFYIVQNCLNNLKKNKKFCTFNVKYNLYTQNLKKNKNIYFTICGCLIKCQFLRKIYKKFFCRT